MAKGTQCVHLKGQEFSIMWKEVKWYQDLNPGPTNNLQIFCAGTLLHIYWIIKPWPTETCYDWFVVVCSYFHTVLGTHLSLLSCVYHSELVLHQEARCSSVVRAFAHGAMGRRIDPSCGEPIEQFSFQPMLHNWCNKGSGMCYPVCGMVHIKEPLLLIVKCSLCGSSGFPFSLSEWSLTICLTPYNRK